ncbi:MAG: DNA polymerase III subunit alpha [Cyanobium sp. ARS6]|nr:MAG: DNA polymerase III subunit alpha [Cyanobium sp. ARS6]
MAAPAEDAAVASTDLSLAPKAAPVKDYHPSEKLKLEKDLVGFYLSDHPLKQLTAPARLLAPIGLACLEEQADKSKISAIAMISEMRQVTTRKGDRMAILQLEDLTGSCEAVVFPKSYARLSDHLMAEARLLVWAAVDRRDERVQLIVDDCRAIDDLRLLLVELDPDQACDVAVQHKLRECLQAHRPDQDELGVRVPVVAAVRKGLEVRYVRLGPQFCVRDVAAAQRHLQNSAFTVSCSDPLMN